MRDATVEQKMRMARDGFVSMSEAATVLTLHISTLYRWADAEVNAINHTRVSARRYIDVPTLAAYLRRHASPMAATMLESYRDGVLAVDTATKQQQ